MPGVREIKRRIRSVKNIRQITMALEAVSASRVRRATAQALAARAYANLAMQVLMNIGSSLQGGTALHPLLADREEVKAITLVLVTSDRGLSGPYNTNVIRVARAFANQIGHARGRNTPVRWIAIGRKGRDILVRLKEHVVAEFTGLPAFWTVAEARPISRVVIDEFLQGHSDEVYVAYTDFINTLTQRPRVQRILPLMPQNNSDLAQLEYFKSFQTPAVRVTDYLYEPSASAILDEIVPKFTENVIYELLLESAASEQAARMVAMRNASENAKELAQDLSLTYNKARQAAITSEILDIVGGVEALKKTGRKGPEAESPVESPELVDTAYRGM
jgi:F-type H+-transporting ATPase subunit gamma